MPRNPFLYFHRAAEAAAYPALLIVSMVCLALVVVPVMLLGLTRAGWVLALAVLSMIAAVAILVGEIEAALSDSDEPAAEGTSAEADATDQREPVVALPSRKPVTPEAGQDREAA